VSRVFSCVLLSFCLCRLAAQTPGPGVSTIRTSTQIVLEDVTVTDAHGKPVHGLTRDSFIVKEDGKPQTVSGFDESSFISSGVKVAPFPKVGPGVFTNFTPAPETGAINVLLLDTLNTPLADQAYARAQVLQFLKNMNPGTRMAIFVMNRELHLLQGFTSNPELLKAAMVHKRGTGASSLLDSPVSGGLAKDSTLSDSFSDAVGNDPSFDETVASLQQLEAEQATLLFTIRAGYTLDAMNQMARYLSGLPGRKNLIWFSGSFPLDLMPDGDLPDPFAAMASSEDEFRDTVNLMTRSHVAVYPVDVRGLMVNPVINAENSGKKYSNKSTNMQKDNAKFFDQTSAEHDTMSQMAERTGGKAFFNTNGLKEAVEDAVQAGSNYYSLSYVPHEHRWDGKYHNISIKLAEPLNAKLKLGYRVGYFADDPDGPPPRKPKEEPLLATSTPDPQPTSRQTAMQAAMRYGAPQPTEIVMKVLVQSKAEGSEDEAAEGNTPALKVHGPYKRYTVDYAADARNVEFVPNIDGTSKATVEFAVVVYDDQGQVVNTLTQTAAAKVDAAHRAEMIKTGMHFHQEISVPAKGHFWLRTGVHDRTGDRLGSVEVDLERIQRAAVAAAASKESIVPGAPK